MTEATTTARYPRHLRVAIALAGRSARVQSVWLVDRPAAIRPLSAHPIVAVVDLGDRTVSVQSHQDPRVTRSTMAPERGHHYGDADEGTLVVTVPFDAPLELSLLRLRVADLTRVEVPRLDRDTLLQYLERRAEGKLRVYEFRLEDLQRTRDWVTVARQLGLPAHAGSIEIYVDRSGEYRWRLRRPDGAVVADSGEGYRSRRECETDLLWVRANAGIVPVTSADVVRPHPLD